MASEYGYITVSDLETFTGINYDAKHSRYTDPVIEAVISQAEEMVNAHTQTSFTGTIPGNVKYITKDIAQKMMNNRLFNDGYIKKENYKWLESYWNADEYDPMLESKKNYFFHSGEVEKGV